MSSITYSRSRMNPVEIKKEEQTSTPALLAKSAKAGYSMLSAYDKYMEVLSNKQINPSESVYLSPTTNKYEKIFSTKAEDKGIVRNMTTKDRYQMSPFVKKDLESNPSLFNDGIINTDLMNKSQMNVLQSGVNDLGIVTEVPPAPISFPSQNPAYKGMEEVIKQSPGIGMKPDVDFLKDLPLQEGVEESIKGATADTAMGSSMGPSGWTMMALKLLGNKLFDEKTLFGKLFG